MIARSKWMLGAALLLLASAAGCDRSPMDADQEMMRRWAEELNEDASQLREHIEAMRQVAPEQWHARMDEHAGLVTGMLDRMDQRMNEMGRMGAMGMGMGMGDLGSMMGMSAERHREMLDRMQSLRDDMHQLRGAGSAEVTERMPGHLERLEQMARMMEQGAIHMRVMTAS